MPNHMTNRMVVTGPESEVRRFREKVMQPYEEGGQDYFDFEGLVPMPDSVRNTEAASRTNLGVEILTGRPKLCSLSTEIVRGRLRFCLSSPGTQRSFLTFDWIRKE